jgi:predicted Fe-S protein YdhL (DUF1289 family)
MAFMPQSPKSELDEVASPCTGVCKLDGENICVGCHRSIDEIMVWPAADSVRRLTILDCCRKRKETRNG